MPRRSRSSASRAPATNVGSGAPVAPDLVAVSRAEDRTPIVHHENDRHPRPGSGVRRDLVHRREAELHRTGRGEVEGDSGGVGAPKGGGQERIRVRRGEQSDRLAGARHIMRHELEQGPAGDQLDQGLGLRHGDGLEVAAEPFQCLAVVVGDPGDQGGGRFRPVALRPAPIHPGGSFGDESFQGTVCVRPGETGRPGDGVAGAGPAGEEDLVDETFSGGESEASEVGHET